MIKRFEAFIGGDWKAWADDSVITKKGNKVTVVRQSTEHGKVTTVFDLTQIPAYSFVE